jgi:hypothetical protein
MVTLLLLSCRERTRCDWILAAGIDLLTAAWIATLIWWL